MTDSHTPIELRQCPFCGGEAEFFGSANKGMLCFVGCPSCKIRTDSELPKNYEDAIKNWNKRISIEMNADLILTEHLLEAVNKIREGKQHGPTPDGWLWDISYQEAADLIASLMWSHHKTMSAIEKHQNTTHHQLIRELVGALEGVIAVADRKTDEFDRAHAVLQTARERMGGEKS